MQDPVTLNLYDLPKAPAPAPVPAPDLSAIEVGVKKVTETLAGIQTQAAPLLTHGVFHQAGFLRGLRSTLQQV